jgi:hypothetical protein
VPEPAGLLLDDLAQVHRAGHHQQGDDHEQHRDLVGDVLGDDAGGGDDRVFVPGGPAAEHDRHHVDRAEGEDHEQAEVEVAGADRSLNGMVARHIMAGAITSTGATGTGPSRPGGTSTCLDSSFRASAIGWSRPAGPLRSARGGAGSGRRPCARPRPGRRRSGRQRPAMPAR